MSDQSDAAKSFDEVLSRLRALRENPETMVSYPRLHSSDRGGLVDLTLQEDGTVKVSISAVLFGTGGNRSLAQQALGEAIANFCGFGSGDPGDVRARPEALRAFAETTSRARDSLVEKMGEMEDYVVSLRSRVEAARNQL